MRFLIEMLNIKINYGLFCLDFMKENFQIMYNLLNILYIICICKLYN